MTVQQYFENRAEILWFFVSPELVWQLPRRGGGDKVTGCLGPGVLHGYGVGRMALGELVEDIDP